MTISFTLFMSQFRVLKSIEYHHNSLHSYPCVRSKIEGTHIYTHTHTHTQLDQFYMYSNYINSLECLDDSKKKKTSFTL